MTTSGHADLGWNFDNSYTRLPKHLYTHIAPSHVRDPRIVIINKPLMKELGLQADKVSQETLAQVFSGNVLLQGAEPIAQAYAGHQFGRFTMLGDGRAHLMGEQVTPDAQRVDIQFKGSGQTPYSRRGDGRAALGPMLREYIMSEAMCALGIPTTRSLAVVTTGDPVYRDTILQGAILTRTASSHLRVGTFEYLAAHKDVDGLRALADYAIARHYPELKESDQPYLDLIAAVMERQVALIVNWLRVGFIHGVMNTDNVTISGETIDYGPCAFMDAYDPQTVFSSIDRNGRYAYANQAPITQWNIARFAETLIPLVHEDIEQAVALVEEVVYSFSATFQKSWLDMMRQKLGLIGQEKEDEQLIGDLLQWMQRHHADYTNTFFDLASEAIPVGGSYETDEFTQWWKQWQSRLKQGDASLASSLLAMKATNPAIIPRNHLVENALLAAQEHSDYAQLHALLDALKDPYVNAPELEMFRALPKTDGNTYQTFCGT